MKISEIKSLFLPSSIAEIKELTSLDKLLLALIGEILEEEKGTITESLASISDFLGSSEKSIRRSIMKLERLGYIQPNLFKKYMPGYVYIFYNERYYKIGRTVHHPDKRRRAIETIAGLPIRITGVRK